MSVAFFPSGETCVPDRAGRRNTLRIGNMIQRLAITRLFGLSDLDRRQKGDKVLCAPFSG